ncbi:glycoside hydrolase family 9 protein [Aquimarina sp. Aq78]|uniref:glycoside hydrolase family 9 protein n=1 Tax=Aquimarina sp. Aq78 TaxID=1191889 RepID=UPI000D102129|nr:glycoside hydrolase family 9 protein [Aquimarina sp. Aq78]
MRNLKPVFFTIVILLMGKIYSQDHNYAEALQKSLYFYDAEKSGIGITGGRLEWRGDSEIEDSRIPLDGSLTNLSDSFIAEYREILDPDGNGTMDLSGGYHDAGDHVKFGLPQSYASSTLEWAFYEFKEAFNVIGERAHIEEILRWSSDYYLRSTFRKPTGEVIAFCYQVGEGSEDHNYWGPPELQSSEEYPRPAYFATEESPASDQASGAAASLALTYLNFKEDDPDYAKKCLETAVALYEFAVLHRGNGYSGGFYNSSFDEDELSWAAIWLHIATSEQKYLLDIISVDANGRYTGWLSKIIASVQDNWQNIWVHSWDTKWGGVFAKLAPVTNSDRDWYMFRWNLEYWSGIPHQDSGDGAYLAKSPAGFSFLNAWGSARYNAAAQFQALVYRKYTGRTDFSDWAKTQMDYILGDNPLKRSYLVGYSDNYAEHPHHRAAHGSSTNNMDVPEKHKHILWGALVGGPDSSDNHIDETSDYVYNEVAIDYNAGAVGALAGHYFYYGQGDSPIQDFPPKEPKTDEYFVEAKVEQENKERSQITIAIKNATVHPPRMIDDIKVRYFFNISELIEQGQSIEDVSVEIYYDQSGFEGKPTKVSEILAWDMAKGIYYVEFDWASNYFYGSRSIQFALISRQDDNWTSHWDPSNDYSRQEINSDSYLKTTYMPVYVNDKLFFGTEPDEGNNNSPVAKIKASQTSGTAPLSIVLSAEDSFDPDGDEITYLWKLPNGVTSTEKEIATTFTEFGKYVVELKVSDHEGLSAEAQVTITVTTDTGGNSCWLDFFQVPRNTSLPSTSQSKEFKSIHVLGKDIALDNVVNFSFNWDVINNGLYQFALNTNNGTPSWYVDLLSNIEHSFGQDRPKITISNSGLAGLDNTYYPNWYGSSFVLVQTEGDYAILFSNSDDKPDCGLSKFQNTSNLLSSIEVVPNPSKDKITVLNTREINEFEITDIMGIRIEKKRFDNQNSFELDVSQYQSGVYFVIYENKFGGIQYKKFVKN